MKALKRSVTAVGDSIRGFGYTQILVIIVFIVFIGIPVSWALIAPDNFWHTMIGLGSMGTGPIWP